MRGRLTRLALALALLTLVPVPARAATDATVLRAGAARVPLRVPDGTPLAGYGGVRRRLIVPDVLGRHPHAFWFRPHEGVLDELAVRALVVYAGGTRVTWIAADLIAVDQAFTRRLEERLAANGIRPGTLIVSASHTHSGPGAFLPSAVFGIAAVDREDAAVRDAVLNTMVAATRRAGAAARDARLAAATVDAPPTTRSRLGRPVDGEIVVLKVTTTGDEPIAVLWNFAIHGTMLGPRNLRLSGDVMGVASRALEAALGVPALFVNGAVGDVSPHHHGEIEAATTGRALADTVRTAWTRAERQAVAAAPLVVKTARVRLPAPSLSLRHCVAQWIPAAVRIPIGRFLPSETEVTAVALGRVVAVTMPGEPVTALGRMVKEAARTRWAHAVVAGVSNDYLGYFVQPEDYDRVGYVTCAAVYGPHAGECLVETALTLLDELAGTAPTSRRRDDARATTSCGRRCCGG